MKLGNQIKTLRELVFGVGNKRVDVRDADFQTQRERIVIELIDCEDEIGEALLYDAPIKYNEPAYNYGGEII